MSRPDTPVQRHRVLLFLQALVPLRVLQVAQPLRDIHADARPVPVGVGTVYQKLGRFEEAIGCYQDAASAMRAAGDHKQAVQLEQAAADTQARWSRWRRNR